MIKSQSIKVLLGVLMLCCAPAVAQVSLGIHGGSLDADGTIFVTEGSSIGVSARANPGDAIGVLVVPMDAAVQGDDPAVVVLMLDLKSASGKLSGQFVVPKGLEGVSFQVVAGALNVDGEISLAMATVMVVSSADAGG
jgi:hypothetical protein